MTDRISPTPTEAAGTLLKLSDPQRDQHECTPDLSVVVPLYNEEESLPHLVEQLLSALRPTDETFELVLVDDGFSDRTAEVLAQVCCVPEVVAVLLRKNYGQTAAMAAGFDAGGEAIVSLDGIPERPADIPMLLAKLRRVPGQWLAPSTPRRCPATQTALPTGQPFDRTGDRREAP